MALKFAYNAEGGPMNGQGVAFFFAGTPVLTVKRVYKGFAQGEENPPMVWKADISAMGYQVIAGAPDKLEEVVHASVDADALMRAD